MNVYVNVSFNRFLLYLPQNSTKDPERNDTTFPIPKKVYAGVAVATIGTTATVAAVVTLS